MHPLNVCRTTLSLLITNPSSANFAFRVQSAAFDITQHISLKTSRTPVTGFSGTSSSGVVLTNEDLMKINSVLELRTDRQLLSNGSSVGRTELLSFARNINVPVHMLQRYEGAVYQYRNAESEARSMLGGARGAGQANSFDSFGDDMIISPQSYTRGSGRGDIFDGSGRNSIGGISPAVGASGGSSAGKGRRYGRRY